MAKTGRPYPKQLDKSRGDTLKKANKEGLASHLADPLQKPFLKNSQGEKHPGKGKGEENPRGPKGEVHPKAEKGENDRGSAGEINPRGDKGEQTYRRKK